VRVIRKPRARGELWVLQAQTPKERAILERRAIPASREDKDLFNTINAVAEDLLPNYPNIDPLCGIEE